MSTDTDPEPTEPDAAEPILDHASDDGPQGEEACEQFERTERVRRIRRKRVSKIRIAKDRAACRAARVMNSLPQAYAPEDLTASERNAAHILYVAGVAPEIICGKLKLAMSAISPFLPEWSKERTIVANQNASHAASIAREEIEKRMVDIIRGDMNIADALRAKITSLLDSLKGEDLTAGRLETLSKAFRNQAAVTHPLIGIGKSGGVGGVRILVNSTPASPLGRAPAGVTIDVTE